MATVHFKPVLPTFYRCFENV